MNTRVAILAVLHGMVVAHGAAVAEPAQPIRLWPAKAPGEAAELGPEQEETKRGVKRVTNVSIPTMTFYPAPADRANGACVVVCPGGGYNILAYDLEGTEVAEWLNSIGIHAVVLKYRVPRRDQTRPHLAPLQDAQRCIRLVRQSAPGWGIDPNRIGVLGFSAGGNLTVMTGLHYAEQTYESVDQADRISARPNYLIPIYAAYLGDKDDDTKLDAALNVDAKTPPMFMAVTLDDKMRGLHAALLLAELKKAGVDAELHVFSKGGHGYGLRPSGKPVSGWPKLCEQWLRSSGWLERGRDAAESIDSQ
jgi:acetyl esterase/lipase